MWRTVNKSFQTITRKGLLVLALFLLAGVLLGCGGQAKGPRQESPTASAPSYPNPDLSYPGLAGREVTLTGWLAVVRNGQDRYMLADEQGLSRELIIDEALLQSYGGAQAIDRKRVTITGEWTSDTPTKIRVISIQVED